MLEFGSYSNKSSPDTKMILLGELTPRKNTSSITLMVSKKFMENLFDYTDNEMIQSKSILY